MLYKDHPELLLLEERMKTSKIHLAARKNNCVILEALYQNHQDINEIDDKRRSAFHIAAMEGSMDALKWLIDHGVGVAKLNKLKDIDGNTPLHLAIIHQQFTSVQLLLNCFKEVGSLTQILRYANQDGNTPLSLAILVDEPKLVEQLHLEGFRDNISKNKDGYNALQLAVKYGHENSLSALIKNLNEDQKESALNIKDELGNNLIHLAILHHKRNLVPILIQAGVDFRHKNKAGKNVRSLHKKNILKCSAVLIILFKRQNSMPND